MLLDHVCFVAAASPVGILGTCQPWEPASKWHTLKRGRQKRVRSVGAHLKCLWQTGTLKKSSKKWRKLADIAFMLLRSFPVQSKVMRYFSLSSFYLRSWYTISLSPFHCCDIIIALFSWSTFWHTWPSRNRQLFVYMLSIDFSRAFWTWLVKESRAPCVEPIRGGLSAAVTQPAKSGCQVLLQWGLWLLADTFEIGCVSKCYSLQQTSS